AADKPAGSAPAEPLKGEVSRTDSPGAGVSAAHAPGSGEPAPQPETPAAKPPVKPAAPAAPRSAAAAKPATPAGEPAPKAAPPSAPSDPPPRADKPVPGFITALQSALPGVVVQVSYWLGDWTVIVAPERILEVARYLRETPDAAFDLCSDVTASDWPPRR